MRVADGKWCLVGVESKDNNGGSFIFLEEFFGEDICKIENEENIFWLFFFILCCFYNKLNDN